MLNAGLSWRLFFYVEIAFGIALLIFAFFAVEETWYKRVTPQSLPEESVKPPSSEGEKQTVTQTEQVAQVIPERKSFVSSLKFWGVWDRESDFFIMMARSFTYFLVPPVFWVVTTYGRSCYSHLVVLPLTLP
jgi:hypothetical protein